MQAAESVWMNDAAMKKLLAFVTSEEWGQFVVPYLYEKLAAIKTKLETCTPADLEKLQAGVEIYKDLLKLGATLTTRLASERTSAAS